MKFRTGIGYDVHSFKASSHYNRNQIRKAQRVYNDIATESYSETTFGYDAAGRQNLTTSPEGTISRQTYNAMGWNEKVEVGTDDDATTGNMLTVQERQYDLGNSGGNGNLTKVTAIVGGGDPDRVSNNTYDWRNRLEKTNVSDGTRNYLTIPEYDGRGNTIKSATYHTSEAPSNLITASESYFDTRGRSYKSEIYPDDGTSDPQISKTWYDPASNVLRQKSAGSETFVVTSYDAICRPVTSYVGYDPGTAPSDPSDISAAVIMEESTTAYDAASNAIKSTSKQRYDNEFDTETGALGNATTEPKARITYAGAYPDAIGRTQAAVNVGTNGGSDWSRPQLIPPRNEDTLVTSSIYNNAGNLTEVIDPMAVKTCREYDDAGRLRKTIENCVASGGGNSSSGQCVDKNRTTRFGYNLENQMTSLLLENASTGNQETVWAYGVTATTAGSVTSGINSNSILASKTYPDDGVETYKYNRQGQAIEFKDPSLTEHAYTHDKLGRQLTDAMTTATNNPQNIDTTVYKIERSYDDHLRLATVSSVGKDNSNADEVLNQVGFKYNTYGQLTKDIQEHSGEIVYDGENVLSRFVGYDYHNGEDNTTRPISMTFPDGDLQGYAYDGTTADKLSRINKLTLDSKDLCEYDYLGMSSAVTTRYLNLATSPSTVAEQSFATGGTGAGRYAGFDRFGRIIETIWKDSASTTLQNAKYGYNQASNRIWRENAHPLAAGKDLDNFYWYDDLYQVTAREQGTLDGTFPDYTGITNPPSEEEDFCYDETGNWLRYDNKGMEGPDPLHQQRQHNKANEITSITNPSSVIQPEYDPAGNMTKLPQPGDWTKGYDVTWDGWNRIVELKDSSTSATVARYAYDGLTRRTETDTGESTDVRHYYNNRQWRCVEEYLNDDSDPERRYAWGAQSRWEMILRQRSDTSTLDENLYTLYDAMDPVAVVDESGAVKERYAYSTYGETTILKPDFNELEAGSDCDWNLLFHVEFRDETGLYNYGYRYYQPELGRWLKFEPLGESEGGNLYSISRSNLINAIDIVGEKPFYPYQGWTPAGDLIPPLGSKNMFMWRNPEAPILYSRFDYKLTEDGNDSRKCNLDVRLYLNYDFQELDWDDDRKKTWIQSLEKTMSNQWNKELKKFLIMPDSLCCDCCLGTEISFSTNFRNRDDGVVIKRPFHTTIMVGPNGNKDGASLITYSYNAPMIPKFLASAPLAKFNYPYQVPAQHEMGHFFGNDDEYLKTSKFKGDSSSIMNEGSEVRLRHLSAFVAAVTDSIGSEYCNYSAVKK